MQARDKLDKAGHRLVQDVKREVLKAVKEAYEQNVTHQQLERLLLVVGSACDTGYFAAQPTFMNFIEEELLPINVPIILRKIRQQK